MKTKMFVHKFKVVDPHLLEQADRLMVPKVIDFVPGIADKEP